MVIQRWKVVFDEDTHEIIYKFSRLSGKTVLVVDGDSFEVKGKPFGIGSKRKEPIIVGQSQAILDIGKGGKAVLVVRDATRVEVIK